MIFLVLALIWAAALLPSILHARANRNPVHSVGKFRRHLRVLEATTPNMPHAWKQEAMRMRRRRRQERVLSALLALCGTTLVAGLVPEFRSVLVLHAAIDIALVWYVYALFSASQRRRAQRRVAADRYTYGYETTHQPAAHEAAAYENFSYEPEARVAGR